MLMAPAEPSTAEVAVQGCAAHWARIVMVIGLSMVAPHLLAAAWKAFRRCCPRVVPLFPPTGETAVVSLKPTPAASLLRMTIVAVADAEVAAASTTANKNRESNTGRIVLLVTYIFSILAFSGQPTSRCWVGPLLHSPRDQAVPDRCQRNRPRLEGCRHMIETLYRPTLFSRVRRFGNGLVNPSRPFRRPV